MKLKATSNLWVVITLVVLSVGLYHRDHSEFTGLDDTLLVDAQWDKMRNPDYAVQAFKQSVFIFQGSTYYRPLLTVGLMVPALIMQSEEPDLDFYLGYAIFWLVVTLLTLYYTLEVFGFTQNFRLLITWFIAVHPAMVVGVHWIPGLGDLMLTTLALWSLFFFVKWSRQKKPLLLILHLVFWISATLTKEAGILLPPLFVFLSVLLEDFNINSKVWKERTTPMLVILDQLHIRVWGWIKANKLVSGLWIALLLGWVMLRAQTNIGNSVGFLSYINNIPYGTKDLVFLISSILVPLKTAPLISVDWITFLLSLPGFILLIYITWKYRVSNEMFVVFILWLLAALITSTISDYVILHRLIIAMTGLAFGFSFLEKALNQNRNAVILGFVVVLTLFGFFNLEFQSDYRDARSFWTAIRDRSNLPSFGHTGLGNLYQTQKKPELAKDEYLKSLKYERNAPFMYVNLGRAYLEMGEVDSAIFYIQMELDSGVVFNEYVHFALGCALIEKGEIDKGIAELRLGSPYYDQSRFAREAYDSLETALDVSLIPKKE